MTRSTSLADHAPPSAHATVSALLIPADPSEPLRRLQVDGREDLNAALGRHIEGLPCPSDPSVWGYVSALGRYVSDGEPNARASSILDPDGPWIIGDVLLLAFDRQQECDLPAGFEDRIEGADALPAPELSARSPQGIVHAWQLASEDDGKRTLAVLTVTRHPALEPPVGPAEEYSAMLSIRSEAPDLFGGTICCDAPHMAFCVRRERRLLSGAQSTDRFAAAALATLRALYAAGDERVLPYFRGLDRHRQQATAQAPPEVA